MEKIFKKSLALVLSAALCLTALVGCLTVSAADETTTPIYEMVGAEGKAGETVTITVKLQNIEGICAHHVKFTFAKELTVVSMYDVTRDKPVKFDTDVAEGENFQFKKGIDTNTGVTTVEDVNILNFVKSDNTYDEHTPSLTLTFSVKIADGTADGNYAVNVTATAADQGEAWVNTIDFRNSNVVVKNTVAPVLDANIKVNRYIQVTSTLNIGYFITNSQVADYDHIAVEAIPQKYDANYNEIAGETKEITDFVAAGKTMKYAVYNGIGMYELGLNVSARVLCYDAENNLVAYSETYVDSPANLLKDIYATSKDTTFKTAVTDMLNMGAEAQVYFGSQKAGSDLSKATLVNDGFDQTYATPELDTLNEVNSTVRDENAPISNALLTTVSLTGAPAVGYLVVNGSTLDKSKLEMRVSYHSNYSNEDVTDTVTGSAWATAGKYLTYSFTKTALYDGNKTVTAEIYYDGALVLTNQYSVESYVAANQGNATMGAALVAIAKFGKSCRAYFKTT